MSSAEIKTMTLPDITCEDCGSDLKVTTPCGKVATHWAVVHGVAGATFNLCRDHLDEWILNGLADYHGVLICE